MWGVGADTVKGVVQNPVVEGAVFGCSKNKESESLCS